VSVTLSLVYLSRRTHAVGTLWAIDLSSFFRLLPAHGFFGTLHTARELKQEGRLTEQGDSEQVADVAQFGHVSPCTSSLAPPLNSARFASPP